MYLYIYICVCVCVLIFFTCSHCTVFFRSEIADQPVTPSWSN